MTCYNLINKKHNQFNVMVIPFKRNKIYTKKTEKPIPVNMHSTIKS